MSNCLRLGDEVIVDPYFPHRYPDTEWLGRVKKFETYHGTELVLVEALDRDGADSLVETEMWFGFKSLRPYSAENRGTQGGTER